AGQVDLTTFEGRADLLNWWVRQGRTETLTPPVLPPDCYHEPSAHQFAGEPLPLTRGLEAQWRAEPALYSALDLSTLEGMRALTSWWLIEGRKLEGGSDLVSGLLCRQASPFIEQDQPLVITRGLHALALARPELQSLNLVTP